MARERSKKDDGIPVPGWVVTYGDMMSLLLTFFVLLLSFSSISEEEFKEAISSLQGALGVMPAELSVLEQPVPAETGRPNQPSRDIERLARELRRKMLVQGKDEDVKVEFDKSGGLKISLPNQILFDLGSDLLKDEAFPILIDVGSVLALVPNAFVEVRGHTDNIPVRGGGRFQDNYDLSYYRAKAVMRYLNAQSGIPPEQFEVIGCGEFQPVATNDTLEGQAANRRVELFVRGDIATSDIEALRNRLGGNAQAATPAATGTSAAEDD